MDSRQTPLTLYAQQIYALLLLEDLFMSQPKYFTCPRRVSPLAFTSCDILNALAFPSTGQSILGINTAQQLNTHRLSVSVISLKNFEDSCYLQKVIRDPAEHLTLNKCGNFTTQKVLSGK